MTQILFGNYEPDIASIRTNKSSVVSNVIPSENGYAPFSSLSAFTTALSARCLGYFSTKDLSGATHLFAGTSAALYKMNNTTLAWDDVSKVGGYTVSTGAYWSFAQFGNNIIAVTDSNNPQLYTLGSSTDFADLGGSPPQAKHVEVIGDFLVLVGLTANANRIRWSGLNDITQWTSGTASSDYQDFPDGGFVMGAGGGEFGIVFQEDSIRKMIFNPSGTAIFDFSRITENIGLYMPYSLAKTNNSMFFYASDGFYMIGSGGQLKPIGANKTNKTFLADADLGDPRYLIGATDPNSQRVYWAYKSKGNSSTSYLDKIMVYDWLLDRWSIGTVNVEYIGHCFPVSITLESMDSVGNLDSLTTSFDAILSQSQDAISGVNSSHQISFFSGAALEATMDSPEGDIGEGKNTFVRQVMPISDTPSAYMSIKHRRRLQDAQSQTAEKTINANGYCNLRLDSRFMQGSLRIPAGTAWTYARGVDVEATPSGVR